MYNLGDDIELDRLSREAAGKYEVPGDANWPRMQEELDKVLPVQKEKRRTVFLWWLLPLLLLGGATYWWLETRKDAGVITEKKIPVNGTVNFPNTQASPKENTSAVPKEDVVEKNIASEASVEKPILPVKTDPLSGTISLQKAGKKSSPTADRSLVIRAEKRNEQVSYPAPDKSTSASEISKNIEKPMTDKPVITDSKNNTGESKLARDKINADKLVATNTTVVKDNYQSVPEVIAQSAEPTIQSNDFSNKSVYISPKSKWSLAFLAGVDKSTVKFKYGNDPGYNIGVLAGYHFNSRWSVHTGAIYTQKNYKLAGEDFTAPKGSWISNYTLENVQGYCRMWELPILARFNISNQAKQRVFISTGLSSYFMTKENYHYFFYNAGQPTTRHATYTSTAKHILSIAHLSAGFENQLSRNLSLQIEPYAKIPLGNVGLGNIKLSSFGVNFAVQYRQQSKK